MCIVSSPNKQSTGTLALIYGLQTGIFFISSPRFWGANGQIARGPVQAPPGHPDGAEEGHLAESGGHPLDPSLPGQGAEPGDVAPVPGIDEPPGFNINYID